MKRHLIIACCMMLLIIPFQVKANEIEDLEIIKYYKTITYENNDFVEEEIITHTTEISKEEYDLADTGVAVASTTSGSTETTYKKMTTTIQSNGNYYRYKNKLIWKNIPKVRSYDIIGIGFLASVKVKGSPHFEQYYCYDSGGCVTSTTNYPQTFATGAGTSFALPTGSLSRLEQTFYFDVEKNTSYEIISQYAYGDYSHATSTVSLANSKKYSVTSGGINLETAIYNSYDSINKATASWSGSW